MNSYLRHAALVIAGITASTAVIAAEALRPNFVFIIGDDISADDLGCYGNPGIRTPNLDRLAAESFRSSNTDRFTEENEDNDRASYQSMGNLTKGR